MVSKQFLDDYAFQTPGTLGGIIAEQSKPEPFIPPAPPPKPRRSDAPPARPTAVSTALPNPRRRARRSRPSHPLIGEKTVSAALKFVDRSLAARIDRTPKLVWGGAGVVCVPFALGIAGNAGWPGIALLAVAIAALFLPYAAAQAFRVAVMTVGTVVGGLLCGALTVAAYVLGAAAGIGFMAGLVYVLHLLIG